MWFGVTKGCENRKILVHCLAPLSLSDMHALTRSRNIFIKFHVLECTSKFVNEWLLIFFIGIFDRSDGEDAWCRTTVCSLCQTQQHQQTWSFWRPNSAKTTQIHRSVRDHQDPSAGISIKATHRRFLAKVHVFC